MGFQSQRHQVCADFLSKRTLTLAKNSNIFYVIFKILDWRNAVFNWFSYLRLNRAEAISKDAFHTRNPRSFEVGMALEVVDRKNPCLIRPAVITDIYEYDIKVLYIGWPEEYAYWLPDDSMDIHPPGWCKRTNHPVEFPLGKLQII